MRRYRRIPQGRDQREFACELLAERDLVIGNRGPRLLLLGVVVVTGQFLDRRGEDRREHGRVRRQERPQRRGRGGRTHRATSHVVPSLESLIATPMAASSSRMRSDSVKSFRARAAVRSAISALTWAGSMPLACRLRPSHCVALSDRKPSRRSEPENSFRLCSLVEAACRRPCKTAIICAVLRSSDSASTTAVDGCPASASAATAYQSSSDFAVSSTLFNVQSSGER